MSYLKSLKMKRTFIIFLLLCIAVTGNSQNFSQILKAVASDRAATDFYGYSVSIDGDYAIIGSYLEDEDAAGGSTINNSGSAYIYWRNGAGNWLAIQKIVASDRALNDEFGYAVGISGSHAVVGARWEDHDVSGSNNKFNAGSAYVFELDVFNGQWNEVQKIVSSDRALSDEFGSVVAISGDNIIIGSEREDEDVSGSATLSESGSAYIFKLDVVNGLWNEVQKIVASDRESGDNFGHAVSISGGFVIIGAVEEDHDTSGTNQMNESGSAYFFERDTSGTWNQVQKIVASDRAANDEFGVSVSISGDFAIIGSAYEDDDAAGANPLGNAGSAYFFERDFNGTWIQKQKIVSVDRGSADNFGWSVSIHGDYAIIGAVLEDEDTSGTNTYNDAGSAYIFKRDGFGSWNQQQKITASDRAVNDFFGTSVSIHSTTILVGAYLEDHNAAGIDSLDRSGSAYLFGTCNTSSMITINACDNYSSPSGTFIWTTSGIYIDTIPNANLCDSIITIDLTIDNSSSSSISPTACDSYTSPSGKYTWTSSGIFVDTIENVNLCDSLITINLSIDSSSSASISPTACDSYSSPSGTYTWTSTGIYMDTIPNAKFCDSIITIDLTINSSSKSTINPTTCNSYSSPSGNNIWTSSDIYMDTIPNNEGCDSFITVNLTINTVDTSVTQTGLTLTANSSTANYQWLDCYNGYSPIIGDTNQIFQATINGSFAVEVNDAGCIDTSNCRVQPIGSGFDNDFASSLLIYPNPTTGKLFIFLGQIYHGVDLTVRNILGKLIFIKSFEATAQLSFDINDPNGVYFVEIKTNDGSSATFRILKE